MSGVAMTAADVVHAIERAGLLSHGQPPVVPGGIVELETRMSIHGVPWTVLDEVLEQSDGLDWTVRFTHDDRSGTAMRTASLNAGTCRVTIFTTRVPVTDAELAGVAS